MSKVPVDEQITRDLMGLKPKFQNKRINQRINKIDNQVNDRTNQVELKNQIKNLQTQLSRVIEQCEDHPQKKS